MPPPPLPTEILREIGRNVTSLRTLRALACADRRFHAIFDPILYQTDARWPPRAAIAWAAEHGVMGILQKALNYGAEIAAAPSSTGEFSIGGVRVIYGMSTPYHFYNCPPPHPLCLAIQHGQVDIAYFLIERGCSVNMRNPEGLTLLSLAVIHGHVDFVRTLLGRGAGQDRRHAAVVHSPIQIAAFQGAKEVVELLLHHGPTTQQIRDAIQCTLLEGHKDILPPLLATGVGLDFIFRNCRLPGVYTPLVWAAEEGDAQLVQILLSGGTADPNYWTGDGNAIPLVKAVLKKHEEVVRILVGPTSRLQRTRALALSMDYPDGRIAQILLENGALPDFEQDDQSTLTDNFDDSHSPMGDILMPPLMRAILRGHTNLVRLLVARGANINVEYRGWIGELPTWVIGGPLALAEQLGDQETANFLRDQGAKPEVGTWLYSQFANWTYNRPSQ
ncbi:ankyrin repeat-containing domain protein [Aspergillus similis]